MSDVRVVVTGMGLVCALGRRAAYVWPKLVAGERGFGPLSVFSAEGQASGIAAEARLPVADGHAAPRSRSEALAFEAAHEALSQARLDASATAVDLVLAASTGGMYETERALTALYDGRPPGIERDAFACHPISAPADFLGRALGPFVTSRTVCSACAGGAIALAVGAMRVRLGRAGIVLAGGVDALSRLTFTGFGSLGSLDPSGSRPFDVDRRGLSLGEGAAFLVLEREADAAARGAIILGELAGFSIACEAHHITQPDPSGATAVRVMRGALADAGIDARSLAYISAHGTGTPQNDAMEAAAIATVVGDHAARIAVSSQKGQLGHTLSAAGALEAAVSLLALISGVAPPTGGLVTPGVDVGLSFVCSKGVAIEGDAALSNSFGFGGTDASIVMTRARVGTPRAAAPVGRVVVTGVATIGPRDRRGVADAFVYGESDGSDASSPRVACDPKPHLDPDRSRRFDRTSLLATLLVVDALRDARRGASSEVGVVAGGAFGSSEASAAFFARVEAKGPRFASPSDFPNLVPSSAGANASIYNRLGGPTLSVADLGTTAFAALATACEFVAERRVEAMIAVDVEACSLLAEHTLADACSVRGEGARGEGGAALVLEARDEQPGAGEFAELVGVEVWSATSKPPAWLSPPRDAARAALIVVSDDDATRALAEAAGWSRVRRIAVGPQAGWHEAVAAIGLAVAASRIANGLADEVLVVSRAPGRLAAALFVRPRASLEAASSPTGRDG